MISVSIASVSGVAGGFNLASDSSSVLLVISVLLVFLFSLKGVLMIGTAYTETSLNLQMLAIIFKFKLDVYWQDSRFRFLDS